MKFKILPHTADGKFRAFGKTLEERFSNAVLAMFSFMFRTENVEKNIRKKIHVKGKDEKALLYNWLEEFLYLLDTDSFIPNCIEKIKITKAKNEFELVATAVGNNQSRQKPQGSVKAVTYAEMEITDDYVQVVVDL